VGWKGEAEVSQVLYDVDFYEWTAETARLLREERLYARM
jgi:hypothetical protein